MSTASIPHWLHQTPWQLLQKYNEEEKTSYHTLGLNIFISRPGEFLVGQTTSETGEYSVPTAIFADPSGALKHDPDTIRDLVLNRLKSTLSDQAFRTAQLMDFCQPLPLLAVTQTSSTKLDLLVTVTVISPANQSSLMWIPSSQAQNVAINGETVGTTTEKMTRVVVSYSDFSRAVTRLDYTSQKESIKSLYNVTDTDRICTMMLSSIIATYAKAMGGTGAEWGSILEEESPSGKVILLFRRTKQQLAAGNFEPPPMMGTRYRFIGIWKDDGIQWKESDADTRRLLWHDTMTANGRLAVMWS